ncbi:heterokaryon incompatibility protein-domain-containing protein [Apiospora arundinis]|uniref:Heterokaryon incompatibility protein-domain-containing protein n=1 Tax=Apiospora arundinis TaxID=335852 RepID=A0ABR2I9F5_9PEZI
MRLLHTTTFELHSGDQATFKRQGYAILSHRWIGEDEVTFAQIGALASKLRNGGEDVTKVPQLDKIRGACEVARQQNLQWMWIDNCCINKTSAVEETESINSMFKWYRDAKVCITYLFDVKRGPSWRDDDPKNALVTGKDGAKTVPDVFRSINDSNKPSEWFSRGWTLQELLAPRYMQFYDTDWAPLGTKAELADDISAVTGIAARYLTGHTPMQSACIAVKMSWMANRKTTREEDIAYSMLGIFDKYLVPQYGEGGARAFVRLQHALLEFSADESLFAWSMPHPNAGAEYRLSTAVHNKADQWAEAEWGLLAPTPKWFQDGGSLTIQDHLPTTKPPHINRPNEKWRMTQSGLQISMRPLLKENLVVPLTLAVTTIVGWVPWMWWEKHHKEKKAMRGFAYPLNCWRSVGGGGVVGLQIYLRPDKPREQWKTGDSESVLTRRVRCTEVAPVAKYIREGTGATAIVLQPGID